MLACKSQITWLARAVTRTGSGTDPAGRPRGLMSRFARDEHGNVAMIFGLMFTAMFMFVGAAVDIGRWLHARTQTWQALDAAVLAGARTLQLNSSNTAAAAIAAQKFYNENVKTRAQLVTDTIGFSVADGGTSLTATGSAYIGTVFLSMININKLSLFNVSGADMPKAQLAVGGNGETDIEISMMLDITGSMGGSKITSLKTAAKNLIDIVVWSDQSDYTSKVALVPFSEAVNVGSTYLTSVIGSMPTTYTYSSGYTNKTYNRTTCVSERTGSDKYTDVAPSVTPVGSVYKQDACATTNTIIPLSNDKTALKTAIDSYTAGGNTAGHMGTAWAWYMISPNWSEVWPAASQPQAYSKMSELNRFNQPKLRKIAVLMTDGEYNTNYCRFTSGGYSFGIETRDKPTSCTPPNGDSDDQAAAMCTAMKNAGITVYTVGFQVSSTSKTFLKNCSSGNGYYYDAADGTALNQAFIDIALKISSLYLSK